MAGKLRKTFGKHASQTFKRFEKQWVPLYKRKKIHPLWVFAICANQIAINFVYVPMNILTHIYCSKYNLSHFLSSFILLFQPISDLILPPIVILLSDSTTLKYGPRRIFMIIGELVSLLGYFLIGYSDRFQLGNSVHLAPIFFIIGKILLHIGTGIADGPGRTMCLEIMPKSQKILVSSICVFDKTISAIIINSVGAFKLYEYTPFNNEKLLMILASIGSFVLTMVSIFSSPEERKTTKSKTLNPIAKMYNALKSMDQRQWYILVAHFFKSMATAEFFARSANFIAKYIFGGNNTDKKYLFDDGISCSQMLNVILTIGQCLCSFINPFLIKKLGFRLSYSIGTISAFLANLLYYLFPYKSTLFIPYLLMAVCTVITNSVPYAYLSLTSPQEKISEYNTLIGLSCSVSVGLGYLVLTMGLGSMAFFQENPSRLIGISCVFAIFALIFGRLGYGHVSHEKKDD